MKKNALRIQVTTVSKDQHLKKNHFQPVHNMILRKHFNYVFIRFKVLERKRN